MPKTRKPVSKEGRAVKFRGHKSRQTRPTKVTKNHPEGTPAIVGSEERLLAIQRRCFQLKVEGRYHWDIAEIITQEFALKNPATQRNVSDWLDAIFACYAQDLKITVIEEIKSTMARTDLFLQRWLPMAMGNVHIIRRVVIDGQSVEVIDKQAYDEQLKATAECRKLMQLRARILQPQALEDEEGNKLGKGGIAAVVMQTINNIVMPGEKPKPGTVGEVLTLELGERKTA